MSRTLGRGIRPLRADSSLVHKLNSASVSGRNLAKYGEVITEYTRLVFCFRVAGTQLTALQQAFTTGWRGKNSRPAQTTRGLRCTVVRAKLG